MASASRPSSSTSAAASWGCTKTNVITLSYKWMITNYKFVGDKLCSPSFTVGPNNYTTWHLEYEPPNCYWNWVSMQLELESSFENKIVKANIKMSILKADGSECQTAEEMFSYPFYNGPNVIKKWGFNQFVKRGILLKNSNEMLPEGNLSILCEITIGVEGIKICGHADNVFKIPEEVLSDDFNNLLKSKKFADVTLVVDGHQIQAHKSVLAARSNVFAVMFEAEMQEKKLNRVVIIDVDRDVLEEMLNYIYTGKVPNIAKLAEGLLAAAEKYALKNLKVMCEKTLYENISLEKAVDTLILSDIYSAEQLKAETLKFINAHATDIMETSAWKNLVKSHPHLLQEAYCKLMRNN